MTHRGLASLAVALNTVECPTHLRRASLWGHELELEDDLALGPQRLSSAVLDKVDVEVGRARKSDHEVADVDKLGDPVGKRGFHLCEEMGICLPSMIENEMVFVSHE